MLKNVFHIEITYFVGNIGRFKNNEKNVSLEIIKWTKNYTY